jgi:exonuclease III
MEQRIRAEWGFDCYFSSFKSNSRGVAILFNNTFEFKVLSCKTDPNGNFLALSLEIYGCNITLINLYGPNKDDRNFYETVNGIITDNDNPHTIICGDWNLVLDVRLDCFNYVNINNPLARQRVLDLCNQVNLIDPWRIQNPESKKYTWRQNSPLKQSRLDFFLISSELNTKLASCDIKPGYRTDHSMVDLQLDFNQVERGVGYWKFNNSLLIDAIYVDQVKTTIREIVDRYAASPYQRSNLSDIHPKDIHFIINDQLFLKCY